MYAAPLSPPHPTALLTPAMAGVLDRIRRAGRPPWHTLSASQARAAYEAGAEVLDLPRAPLVRVEDRTLPTAPGVRCRARLYSNRPADRRRPQPALLYLHGGGFVVGGLETHDSLCRQLALHSEAAVLALDYRLAPEHPFPAAVEDAWGALRWLFDHAAEMGLDARRLAVGGDSAGGTLAAVAAILARDAGLPLGLQVLITPGTAPDDQWPSRRLFADGFLLDAVTIEWFFAQVLPRGARHDWRFAPLLAPDLEGVAPAVLLLADCDPLVDEGLAYGDRLRAAGIAVSLERVRGVTHDFIKMGRAVPEARPAQRFLADSLRLAWEDALPAPSDLQWEGP
jgi:acetyl esterase